MMKITSLGCLQSLSKHGLKPPVLGDGKAGVPVGRPLSTEKHIGVGWLRLKALAMAVLILGGCAELQESSFFSDGSWANDGGGQSIEAERGLAALSKGNFVAAERLFLKAQERNPNDYYAALGLGMIYQHSGEAEKARAMFRRVIAVAPDKAERFFILNSIATEPVEDIARHHLAFLESANTGMPRGLSANAGQPPVMASGGVITGAPMVQTMFGRHPKTGEAGFAVDAALEPLSAISPEDENVVSRFITMKRLRDQGLLTQQEFNVRRRANIGALLPLTSPPPAAGLQRSVPATDQISNRLQAIGRALELRAISISQHAAERTMILDALMPEAPKRKAQPALPPQGLLEAADAVRRLEMLKEAGIISSDEYTKERNAIEKAMQSAGLNGQVTKAALPTRVTQPTKKNAKTADLQPAVHLASYRSEKEADDGWKTLRATHSSLLSGLNAEVSVVNLGPRKGKFFRLKAGPFASTDAATDLCRALKSQRQYCEPTFMNGG